jgi:quercetin dioxygenase-like cupin family protein
VFLRVSLEGGPVPRLKVLLSFLVAFSACRIPSGKIVSEGRVLAAEEGEVLRRPNGKVVIKVDPRTGSARLAMGTQDLLPGAGIRVHRHEHAEEVLFIHQGSGTAILGDGRRTVEPGTTIYIPAGVWHGVENSGKEMQLVWLVSPPGLEGFFREIGAPPESELKVLTPGQMEEIARKHGTVFKPQ